MPARTDLSTERAVFLGDFHVPLHDPQAVGLALEFVRWFRPHAVFVMGDFLDCTAPSRFEKDPAELLGLQAELDQGRELLARLRSAARLARLTYLDGNHEHRLPKYLRKCPELSSLRALRLPQLLGLGAMGYRHLDYHESATWSGLRVEHGDRASKHSGYTAKAMLEARGVSGISGHTHRLASFYKTDHSGVKVWYENGCLCLPQPSYSVALPNWQQGFTVAHRVSGKRRFVAEQVPIVDGKLFYAGKLWTS